MAQQLNIAPDTYRRLEKGQSAMTEERLQKIADILETTPEAIKSFDEKMVFNISHQKGDYAGNITINNSFENLSEVIELFLAPYKKRIATLEDEIGRLKKELDKKK